MSRLLLMRHAKSSWHDPALPDHDRPLNARGQRAAEIMAQAILKRGLQPDGILCSTALRTRMTLAPLLERIQGHVRICYSRDVYNARAEDYLTLVQSSGHDLAGETGILLVLGHNFAIQEAAIMLAGKGDQHAIANLRAKFPTGAVAVMNHAGHFTDYNEKSAELLAFLRPRDLEAGNT